MATPFLSHGENFNFAEIGIGSSVYSSSDTSSLDNMDPPVSLKVLVGGTLFSSNNLWYELGYNYSSVSKSDDGGVEISTRAIAQGIRLTSNPINKLSGFIRGGVGTAKVTINSTESNLSLSYLGAGTSLALGNLQNLNFEIKYSQYEEIGSIGLNNTSAFVTFSQFIN